jgi:hypothetical protein
MLLGRCMRQPRPRLARERLRLRGVEFRATGAEDRPAVVCDDVHDVDVAGFRGSSTAGDQPAIRLVQTRSVLSGCVAAVGNKAFLEVSGDRCERIAVVASDLSGAERAVSITSGAKHNADSTAGYVT